MAKHASYSTPSFRADYLEVTVVDVLGKVETDIINSGEKCAAFIEEFRKCSMPKQDLINLDVTLANIFSVEGEEFLPENKVMNMTLDGMEFYFEKPVHLTIID